MQIKDKINQTLGFVEQYYHIHKRDALKPKIWDLIVAIRYLVHEVNAVEERNDRLRKELKTSKYIRDLGCFDCSEEAFVLTTNRKLYCKEHAVRYGYCPLCGCVLDGGYCNKCVETFVDDYDKDYMYDER